MPVAYVLAGRPRALLDASAVRIQCGPAVQPRNRRPPPGSGAMPSASKRPPAMTCASPSTAGPEPGLEVLITGGLDLVAQPGQGLGLGWRRAQAEEVDGLPPGIGRVLDRLEPGPPGGLALLQPADEPGERPVGEFGCQVRDAVAQAERVDEDREVVGGEDLALLQDGPVHRDPAAGPAAGMCLAGAGCYTAR